MKLSICYGILNCITGKTRLTDQQLWSDLWDKEGEDEDEDGINVWSTLFNDKRDEKKKRFDEFKAHSYRIEVMYVDKARKSVPPTRVYFPYDPVVCHNYIVRCVMKYSIIQGYTCSYITYILNHLYGP